ncbi:DUF6705 family protein [Pontimicrobium sp. MEBiC01747]
MKNIYIHALMLLMAISSWSQNLVAPIETQYTTNFLASDVSFKDVNGELNKFIGTWVYEDTATNTHFEITFSKIEDFVIYLRNCTEDRLTAQFKLIIDGVEQYNTYITDYGKMIMVDGFASTFTYLADGSVIKNPPSVNRYHLAIVEPGLSKYIGSSDLTIEYTNTSGEETLDWKNAVRKVTNIASGEQVNVYKMPLEMVLVKQ